MNLNLNVLTLGKDVNWPLFKNLGADDGMVNISCESQIFFFFVVNIIIMTFTNLFFLAEEAPNHVRKHILDKHGYY